jgi:hypothetical protein
VRKKRKNSEAITLETGAVDGNNRLLGLAFHETQMPLARAVINGAGKRRGRAPRQTGHNLLLRLAKRKEDTLCFLRDPTVPFTNNQAERDGRMMKLVKRSPAAFGRCKVRWTRAYPLLQPQPPESKAGISSTPYPVTHQTWSNPCAFRESYSVQPGQYQKR